MSNMLCPRCWGTKRTPHTGVPCAYCSQTGQVEDRQLSKYFKLSELVYSQHAVRLYLANDPSEVVIDNLTNLAVNILDHIRFHFGPTHIDSGYRSPEVNAAVGGAATSAHVPGHAADVIIPGVPRKDIVDFIIVSDLSFDQVIFEGTWAHVGEVGPGGVVRRQALSMFPDAHGKPHYGPYDPNDPRVHT